MITDSAKNANGTIDIKRTYGSGRVTLPNEFTGGFFETADSEKASQDRENHCFSEDSEAVTHPLDFEGERNATIATPWHTVTAFVRITTIRDTTN